jgi:integrase
MGKPAAATHTKFSARFVETVATKQPRVEFFDTDETGLMLRVTKGGAKSWAFRYRRVSDGRRSFLSLGRFPHVTLEEARRKAVVARGQVLAGADPAGAAAEAKASPVFSEVAERWLADKEKRGRSDRSLNDVRSMLRLHINPTLGHMRITEMKRRHVIAMLDAMDGKTDARGGGLAERETTTRANHVFAWTRAILRWAMSKDLLEIDPTAGVKPPRDQAATRDRVLSAGEIRALWTVLDAAPAVQPGKRSEGDFPMTRATAIAMQLALVTGQRIGEVAETAIAELSLNDVAPLWTIPAERAKNGVKHEVPLSHLAVRLIREALALTEARLAKRERREGAENTPAPTYLFPGKDPSEPMNAHAPTRALGKARGKIKVTRFNVHDLRRTCATHLGEMGVAPHVISAVLNHVSTARASITQAVYNRHSYAAEKRDALECWGKRLEAILAGSDAANVVALPQRRSTV